MPKYRYCPSCSAPLVPAENGGRVRMTCSDTRCEFVHWDNPVPVVAAVVERAGHIVQVRSHGWPEGWYGLVTGFLEAGETPEQGVLREVEEETGLSATMGGFIGLYPFHEMNQLLIAFHVLAGEGEIKIDASELDGYREVPIEEVQPWDRGTGMALRDWLASRGFDRELVPLDGRR